MHKQNDIYSLTKYVKPGLTSRVNLVESKDAALLGLNLQNIVKQSGNYHKIVRTLS